jgi:predicted regulator of Ras-like GTPase activity (Roadblock/LC7/MglB family)
MTRAEFLGHALDEFLAASPEVEAAAVVSVDGMPIASALPSHVEEDRLAAMSAALLILGERAASGLTKGNLSHVMVEGSSGYVVLMAAGRRGVLVVVTSSEAKPGLLLFEMRRASARVAALLDPGDGAAPPGPGEDAAPGQESTASAPVGGSQPSMPAGGMA